METVIIIRDGRGNVDELLVRLELDISVKELPDGRFLIQDGPMHSWLGRDDDILNDYDEGMRRVILHEIKRPIPCVFEFSDLDFGKQILGHMIHEEHCLIDYDRGLLLSGDSFLNRLRTESSWDWRQD